MYWESTNFDNYKLGINNSGEPVAFMDTLYPEVIYRVYEQVYVYPDPMGYIAPGIRVAGKASIVEIQRHNTDYFIRVRMVISGETGFVKPANIRKI